MTADAPTPGSAPPATRWPRRLGLSALVLVALAPAVFTLGSAFAAARNIVFWDEIDTALDLMLRLDAGLGWRGLLEQLSAINNEHRMLTSRLLYVASWWFTGTIDFRVMGAIGNAFLPALCAVLLWSAGTAPRRLRLAVPLAFLLFSLAHHENLYWSGASIDHLQVPALAAAALVCLDRPSRLAFAGAVLCAGLATFTLAHGLVVWPAGALLLWSVRRWRALGLWLAAAAFAALLFLHGFNLNDGHRFAEFDLRGFAHLGRYWLALLGAPLALGRTDLAPWLGAAVLAAFGVQLLRGVWRDERAFLHVVLFCLGALALVALGRSQVGGGVLHSRYAVLSALALALIVFAAVERLSSAARPYRVVVGLLPVLVGLNVATHRRFAHATEDFVEGRESAALRYVQHGRDGVDPFRLYPNSDRGNQILADAARRGLYAIPRLCAPVVLPTPRHQPDLRYFFDELTLGPAAVAAAGWAALPDHPARRGDVFLVLRSPTRFLTFPTVTIRRADVAAAYQNPAWRLCGFRFALDRDRLPPDDYQVGVLVRTRAGPVYTLTAHRLNTLGAGSAHLASGP